MSFTTLESLLPRFFALAMMALTLCLTPATLSADPPRQLEKGKEDPIPDPEPTNGDGCYFDTTPLGIIRDVKASGDDLLVVIGWDDDPLLPATANIIVLDAGGAPVVSQTVATSAAINVTYTLTSALALVPALGPQLQVRVEDGGGTPLAPELDFRVTFDCSSGLCVFELVDGLRAGWVAITEELMLALDAAEAGGSTNILGDVLFTEPLLEGEILSLAWQLSRLDDTLDLDAEPCACFWAPAQRLKPKPDDVTYFYVNQGVQPPLPDYSTGGQDGPGAAYGLGAQARNGGIPLTDLPEAYGSSRAIMDLRCWSFASWEEQEVFLETGSFMTRFPQTTSCGPLCTGTIRHQTEARGLMEVEAWGSSTETAWAWTRFSAGYDVDGTPLFYADGGLSVETLPKGATTDVACTLKSADQTVFGRRSQATLEADSAINTWAGPNTWGFALSLFTYWMDAEGSADCAVEPVERLYLSDKQRDARDGVIIEPWEYPN